MARKLTVLFAIMALIATGAFIVACGGGGGGGGGGTPASKYFYVANTQEDTVGIFTINSTTGELHFLMNVTTPEFSQPVDLLKHPRKNILYVSNDDNTSGNGAFSVFAINSTGGLEEIEGSPYPTSMAFNMAITPDGKYLYATDQGEFMVTSWLVNSTGGLEELAFSPSIANEAHSIAMHPTGKFFYIGSEESEIHGFALNATGGGFENTPNTHYGMNGYAHNWLSITPDGKYLYSTDAYDSGKVAGYMVNTTTGELTQLAGFPLLINAGGSATKASTISPNGKYYYVALWDTDEVDGYVINSADGSLTQIPDMPVPAGNHPKSLDIDSRGKYLYAVNLGNKMQGIGNVTAYSIDGSTGSLTYIANTPVGMGPKRGITVP